ncbi:TOTE conflict system archaeo-eukaryotic primase domain-containing protein [Proteiniclasticum sp. C24MP]|uniref:TOTE conflict system archaeo-eukaryotic primase domain-containing protein n=1 Tax=Proteiniclasticum sp. C24MP TaxID=3374101 RepID=UPI00375460A8
MDRRALEERVEQLQEENRRLKEENHALKARFLEEQKESQEFQIQTVLKLEPDSSDSSELISRTSSAKEKIDLFKSLFRGREDVCAKRWKNQSGYSPYCLNDFKDGICRKPKVKCAACMHSRFAPLDEERVEGHLRGKYVLGIYPMTQRDTCYFLAMDFDEETWKEDARAVLAVTHRLNLPSYLERSRSGNGCHIWFFFEEEVKAKAARRLGMSILSMAMEECGTIQFSSYDRLFPSQDFLQKEGFGNLIALPLQKEPRENGNAVFLDANFEVIPDQWAYMAQMKRISKETLIRIGRMVPLAVKEEKEKGSVRLEKSIGVEPDDFPVCVSLERRNGIRITKEGLSPRALYFLRGLASYANPEFLQKQAMRQTTYGTPRMTIVYDEDEDFITLPRGKEEILLEKLTSLKIPYEARDERKKGMEISLSFKGQLRAQQEEAYEALSQHENGVLSATTGFGKTVVGARLIAEKRCSALVLVHTRELADQWRKRLEDFLDIHVDLERTPGKGSGKKSVIGQLGGGKNALHGIVDIALMQSLFEKDKSVKPLLHEYGLIIVDECHHISAKNFSRILAAADAKYVYGLTATPIRKDGHDPMIFMHLGPVRYRIDAKKEAEKRAFDHFILPRYTTIRLPLGKEQKEWSITEIYKRVCESESRNTIIIEDLLEAVKHGRHPLVLTERASHVEALSIMMEEKGLCPIVLTGRMKTKDRREALERIASMDEGDTAVIVATGKLIGEGFDVPRLDTLFMAMPIAWKGTITQYSGRLHRNSENKKEVLIYDYVDVHIPVLERMYQKRVSAYKGLGYALKTQEAYNPEEGIFDEESYLEPMMEDIRRAKSSILISSTYVSGKRLKEMKALLLEKYKEGIRVTLNIRPLEDDAEMHRKVLYEDLHELEENGITVRYDKENYLKFVMMDHDLLWYGGIDLLSGKKGNDSMIRVYSESLADELTGILAKE